MKHVLPVFPKGAARSTGNRMEHRPFDIVVFDLDGTLADTAPDLAAALNHALAALDRSPLIVADVRRMVGHGARTLVERGLAATGGVHDDLVDASLARFLDYYGAHIADGSHLFDGVAQALAALTEQGVRLAVCTNKPERLTTALLAALGVADRFAAVVGGDTISARKPDPAPLREAIARAGGGRAAMIGDSINDVAAAHAAGIPCVALTFGYPDRPPEQLGADALIDHYDELPAALVRIG